MIQGKNIYFRTIEENDFEFIVKARNLLKYNEPNEKPLKNNFNKNLLKQNKVYSIKI